MKKTVLFFAAAIMLTFAACGNKTNGSEGGDSILADSTDSVAPESAQLQTERYHYADSNKWCSVHLNADMPLRNGKVSSLVCDSIESMLDNSLVMGEERYTRRNVFRLLTLAVQEDQEDVEEDYRTPWEMDVDIRLHTVTERYAVFTSNCYYYCGGAHGSTVCDTRIFSLKDGSSLTRFFLPGAEKKMQKLLRSGLAQYFRKCGEKEATTTNIEDFLLLPEEGALIPLPVTTPMPDANGVTLTYQQYEVACYAAGMPSFTIPYAKVLPYLTPEACEFLGR